MRLALAASLALAFLAAAPARAADRQGRFAVDGAGAAPCGLFLDARAKRDGRYLMFGGWIDGFATALNIYQAQTFDVTPWQSTDLIAALVADVCTRQPTLSFNDAMARVWPRLLATRLRARSALVALPSGPLYTTTLREVQTRLRAQGHMRAAPSGQWDAGTRAGVAAFQRARGLPVTQTLDQRTLVALLALPAGAPRR